MRRIVVKEVLGYNKPSYNYIKLAEELAELQEVIIKRYLKKEEYKPPMAKVIEEMGDVYLRLNILAEQEGIKMEVAERVHEKGKKLLDYIDAGKYKGGV